MFKKYISRTVLCFLFAGFMAAVPSTGKTAPSDDATAVLKATIDQVIELLKEPAFTDPAQRSSQIDKINAEVLNIFDFEEFSARTIGKRWATFNEQQKNDFMSAFDSLLMATYLEKMDKYDGQSVSYTGTRTSQDNNRVEVQTNVDSEGKEIPVFYQMLSKNNTWVVYDVRIEGMSLVENYRSQFAEIFKSGGTIEDLIERVRKLAADMQAQNQNVK